MQGAMRSANGPLFDVQTFKVYLDDLLQRAGASGDPLEAMLIHQLAQAHFAIGRLHVRASGSRNMDEATACLAAAARLMGECRKTTLAVETFRAKAARKRAEAERAATPRRKKKRPAPAAKPKQVRKQQKTLNTELGSKHSPTNRLNGYFQEAHHEPEPALS